MKTLAAETVEAELQRDVGPHERPKRDTEHEPRSSSEDRGRPAIGDQCAEGESDRRSRRSDERRADAVDLAELLARVDVEHIRSDRSKRLQAPRDPFRPPQGHDNCEAERGVVEDDEDAALLPHRAPLSRLEQEIRAGVQPRSQRPYGDPKRARTG